MLKFLYTDTYDDIDEGQDTVMISRNIQLDKPFAWPRRLGKDTKKQIYKTYRVPVGRKGMSKIRRLKQKIRAQNLKQREAGLNQQKLINNALVYAIGSKYDIQSLKDDAKAKFDSLLLPSGMPQDFRAIVNTVLETSPESDNGLRTTVLWKAGKLHCWLMGDLQLQTLISDNGDFALEVMKEVSRVQKASKKRIRKSLEIFDYHLETLQMGAFHIEPSSALETLPDRLHTLINGRSNEPIGNPYRVAAFNRELVLKHV